MQPVVTTVKPDDELIARVKEILQQTKSPKTVEEVAKDLQISEIQAKVYLQHLAKEGILKRKLKPLRYFAPSDRQGSLFDTFNT